jgi:hypothetical protein
MMCNSFRACLLTTEGLRDEVRISTSNGEGLIVRPPMELVLPSRGGSMMPQLAEAVNGDENGGARWGLIPAPRAAAV